MKRKPLASLRLISSLLRLRIITIFMMLATDSALAQTDRKTLRGKFDLPLFDYPDNLADGFVGPSMEQSLMITKSFYNVAHLALENTFATTKPWLRHLAIGLFDGITTNFPLGMAWVHEEWHRAVMTNRQIDSYNDVYKMNIAASVIAVSRVEDDDLVRLKREYPSEQVRLSAAGIESQNQLSLAIEEDIFFEETTVFNNVVLWINKLGSISYMFTCASNDSNQITDEMNAKEGASIKDRDFTGLDCVAWAYDLHRPDEPYASRGGHPHGEGLNRYRKWDDLNDKEQSYLRRQTYLHLLNLLDPFILGKNSFAFGLPEESTSRWNATLTHQLTSFGTAIDLNLFYKTRDQGLMVIVHTYQAENLLLPGIELQAHKIPVAGLALTPRVMAWLQPKRQRFAASGRAAGGLISIKASQPLTGSLSYYLELSTKSPGWVAGDVHLTESRAARLGIEAPLF